MVQLLIGTTNAGKVTEFEEILQDMLPHSVEIVSLSSLPRIYEISENGKSFSENAQIKAKALATLTGIPTIADDSGLSVDALNGEPGIYSARYAAKNHDYKPSMEENITKLLKNLENIPTELRTARFTAALCIAFPNSHAFCASAHWEGYIAEQPQGTNGFGYDPIFICKQAKTCVALMEASMKNQLSHRKKALTTLFSLHKDAILRNLFPA